MAKKGLVISLVAVAVVAGLAGYKFAVKPETTTEKAPVAKTASATAPKAAPVAKTAPATAPKAAPATAPATAPKAAPTAPLTEKQKADMRARFTERFKAMPAEEKTRRIELLTRALNRESPSRSPRAKEIIQLQLEILQGK